MDAGSDPVTESEKADLEAIAAIRESAVIEIKCSGPRYPVRQKRQKHYSDAINCYTRAIDQKALNDSDLSVLFANRARAASFCQRGLEQTPFNEEPKRLFMQIDIRRQEAENQKAQTLEAVAAAKELLSAMENRGLTLGKAQYQELTGSRKPLLDKSGIIHWSVVLLYAEVMSSDLIEDVCEMTCYYPILIWFSESSEPLPWDKDHAYTRVEIKLYYQAGSGTILSRKEVLNELLEGRVKSIPESLFEDEKDSVKDMDSSVSYQGPNYGMWVKVNEKRTLLDILRQPDHIIPAIPAGKW